MDEAVFDDFFSARGGRLDRDQLPRKVAARYEYQAKRAKRYISSARKTFPKVPQIHFDFVNCSTVNAWAFRHQDRYFIGLSRGLFALLYSMCFRMLANRHILPGLGNLFYERPTLPTLLLLKSDAVEAGQGDEETPKPVDSDRSLFGYKMLDDCVRFFIGHEIAHIVFGHVDYLRATQQQSSIAEFGCQFDDVQSWMMRQALEMEADRAAVWGAVDALKKKVTGAKPVGPPWDRFFSDPSETIFNWAFAICSIFRLCDEKSFVAEESTTFSAPYQTMKLRQEMAMQNATVFMKHHWDAELEDDCRNKTSQASLAVERAFAFLMGRRQGQSCLLDPDDVRIDQPLPKMRDFLKDDLKRGLKEYAYF